MLYPLTFQPIFEERVWGGRRLGELYGKVLPPSVPIGESWEITDRPEGVSVIANGPLAGKTLRWLMEQHSEELLGEAKPAVGGRFPLLVKLLDAQVALSLQVHPPASKAAALHGEPKTEMWYVAEATPEADIFVGLKQGVTPEEFRQRTAEGSVAQCFHQLPVRKGDVMFLPSGRVHALGAGSVVFEIQQNSDTTYRVFDWNRVGLDGKPRELHIEQALASIDFNDFEPPLTAQTAAMSGNKAVPLIRHQLFGVDLLLGQAGIAWSWGDGRLRVLAVAEGSVTVAAGGVVVKASAGGFVVLPAGANPVTVSADTAARLLVAVPH